MEEQSNVKTEEDEGVLQQEDSIIDIDIETDLPGDLIPSIKNETDKILIGGNKWLTQ